MRPLPLVDPGTPQMSLAAVVTGRTVVAIAHRLPTASDADRVAVVEDDRVSVLGGCYAALWASWRSETVTG